VSGSPPTSAPPRALFELHGVSRVFGDGVPVYALDEVSLTIVAGDFMAIIGPSGSGKSTLLGLLGCLDVPTAGTIAVDGREVTSLGDAARSETRGAAIGFVFQQFHLIPHLTALANVETALLYRNLSRRERREQAMDALTEVGLAERHDHRPVQLSGGEQQRVAIARAIVTDPMMVLADEPTGALDSKSAAMVMEIFESLRSPERAIVLVTHDLEIAERMDRVVSMRDGHVIADERRTERHHALRDNIWGDDDGDEVDA
jgi:putative ABC transport system ATP-binding protein